MRNNNELKENVSKSAFLIGLLIEISVCLVGFLLQALLIEVGLKYFCYIIFGIMFIYFMGRNYFFISFSSAILGIRWKKNRLGRTLATRAIDKRNANRTSTSSIGTFQN